MTFFGRLIGVFLGYLVLGPLGALLGFIVGSLFDRGLKLHLYQIPREHTAAVQQAFFMATFSVMGHLAKADGRVSQQEIRAAENIMSRLELNEGMRLEAMRLFNEGKQDDFDIDRVLGLLMQECHRHHDLLRFFIEIQLEAALADGELTTEEQQILLHICDRLNFSPREFQQLWARQWASQAFHHWYQQYEHYQQYGQYDESRSGAGARNQYQQHHYQASGAYGQRAYSRRPPTSESSLHDAYGVLGVSSSASQTEIKKAYRKLMNQHHPDKLASRGLPETMIKLAKEKTQQIRAAYDMIREARGFK